MTGVRFRSKDPSASLDETAGNNIDASCDNGQTLYGNGLYWGEWSDWVYCPANTAICGIKTRGSVTLLREAFKRKEIFGKGGGAKSRFLDKGVSVTQAPKDQIT